MGKKSFKLLRCFKLSLPLRKVYTDSIPSVLLHGIRRFGSQSEYCPEVPQDPDFFYPTAMQQFEHCDFLMLFIIAIRISPNNIKSLR